MDDAYVGTTPYKQKDSKILFTTTSLRLKMDGYEPFQTRLSKAEQADVGAIIAGCFVYFPFLWAEGYLPEHTYELTPLSPPAAKQ